ncbi:MAG: hypothetical protein WBV33_19115, partial [Terracidiphilus sp.]
MTMPGSEICSGGPLAEEQMNKPGQSQPTKPKAPKAQKAAALSASSARDAPVRPVDSQSRQAGARISRRAADRLRNGHVWVYASD